MNSHRYASEADMISALRNGNADAFACLYDQYAPILLGIIVKTVGDPRRGELVLADTFALIRSAISSCPDDQPLFLWLFDITRQTAANALAIAPKSKPATMQVTASGRVVTRSGQAPLVHPSTDTKQRLLNAVLFERCTPQEASHAAGLPTENARQHLRQAFLQLRG